MSVFLNAAYLTGKIQSEDHLFFNRIVDPFATTNDTLAESYGGSYPALSGGTRIPLNVLSKNPLMTRPNVSGLRYFGQNKISRVCMDQPFARRIGQFPTPQHGAGMNFYDFSTNPTFLGSQNVASLTGSLLYGSQFKNVSGATELINGSLSNILVSALTDILNLSLPDSLQSLIPGLSSITSALTGATGLTGVFDVFSGFSFSDPTSTLLTTAISGAVSSALGGNSLTVVSSEVNQLISTSQSFLGSVPAISPATALAGYGNGTSVLQNALDQAINTSIPNASMIISSTFNDVTSITNISGSSFTETVPLNDPGSIIPYASAAAQTFAGDDKDPFGLDIHSRGFKMSKDVSDYINKRNSRAL